MDAIVPQRSPRPARSHRSTAGDSYGLRPTRIGAECTETTGERGNFMDLRRLGTAGRGRRTHEGQAALVLPLTGTRHEPFFGGWYIPFIVDHALFVGLPIAIVLTRRVPRLRLPSARLNPSVA